MYNGAAKMNEDKNKRSLGFLFSELGQEIK
jgi:hypothetical protein